MAGHGASPDPPRRPVIVSWNELQRTCQKGFRGLGVPAGADDDSAFAVLWLQARGLDALAPLDAALDALERVPPHRLGVIRRADGIDVLDAGGQSALSIASDALDFAVARALEREAPTEVLLAGVEGEVFVAGALAQRAPAQRARVEWRDGETRRRLEVTLDGACRLCATPSDRAASDDGPGRDAVRILIDGPARRQRMERGPSWRTVIDDAELERRAAHSLTHGIHVPDALWTRLLAFANRTLVPASHASRERGAGGGEYDD